MAWRVLLLQLSLFPLRLSGACPPLTWDFKLQQPQDKVSVTAGETLTLTCTTSGNAPAGPVKWLKGRGSGNQTIYDQTGSFPRVTREVDESNTDFTIHIRDVQPEDAGTYYCVKFCKSVGGDEVFQHGKGTEVSIHETTLLRSMVAVAVVLCFLLLLGVVITLCMCRRKHRGTPGTPSEVLDAESSHLPSQQSSKEDNYIHYADLQPLPAAPRHIRSPGAACSEYASVRVATK